MIKQVELDGLLALEQYRSREKKTAIECALNNRLMFGILLQTKRPAGICACDLDPCYDRIVHSFASMEMQRAGAHLSAVESMLVPFRN